jgi:NADH dehydrogenase (ubiquinone) 1 alpha subcomplex subunit 12
MSLAQKFRNFALAIRQNGGYWGSIKQLYRTDDVKDGTLVGVDRNGNRYYQNNRYFVGKQR